MMIDIRLFLLLLLVASWQQVSAFGTTLFLSTDKRASSSRVIASSSSSKSSSSEDGAATSSSSSVVSVERVLKDNYPAFYALLRKNENIFSQLEEAYAETGYTIFAPNDAVFAALDDKKRFQLENPRNLDEAQKMGLYHIVVNEALSMTQLNREDWTVPKTPEGLPALKYRGLVTLGGEVPIGRFKKKASNNFLSNLLMDMGIKRSEDMDVGLDEKGKPVTEVIIGPEGKIVRSLKLGNAIIHEVNGLVSPIVLWRYFDQLRMPGF
jgi:uncharacterized surface protein with fasciclin (FAS1) repeats